MACDKETITVVSGHNNPSTLVFGSKTGGVLALYDFSATTRIVVELYQNSALADTIDSAVSASAFDWSAGNGEVVFDFGAEAITSGSYLAKMFVYDPSRPAGMLFLGDGDDLYLFDVVVV